MRFIRKDAADEALEDPSKKLVRYRPFRERKDEVVPIGSFRGRVNVHHPKVLSKEDHHPLRVYTEIYISVKLEFSIASIRYPQTPLRASVKPYRQSARRRPSRHRVSYPCHSSQSKGPCSKSSKGHFWSDGCFNIDDATYGKGKRKQDFFLTPILFEY
jgi:hypothetical protein